MFCHGLLWVATSELPKSAGHPFYLRLSELFDEHEFDAFVEGQCEQFYAPSLGRPSLTPGIYFRSLLIGYFEGIDSERGVAWRPALTDQPLHARLPQAQRSQQHLRLPAQAPLSPARVASRRKATKASYASWEPRKASTNSPAYTRAPTTASTCVWGRHRKCSKTPLLSYTTSSAK